MHSAISTLIHNVDMNVKYNFGLYYSELLPVSVNVCVCGTRASSIVKAGPIFAWTRLQTKEELQRMREVCYPDASQQEKEVPDTTKIGLYNKSQTRIIEGEGARRGM